MNSISAPNIRRNIDDHLGALVDRITDKDFGDDTKSIDQLLAPFSTLPVRRGEREQGRAGR